MTLWYIVDDTTHKVIDVFNYPGYGKRPSYQAGTWSKVQQFYRNQNGCNVRVTSNKNNI